jgi:tetratricopeptide (TPR) repeat protein
MRLYTQAVNIDPNYIEAYRNLAEALLKAGNGASAVQVWKTALERSPNDLPILYRLSWIMSTHPDPAVRRTFEPVDLAKRGVELTQSKEPAFLDALAAAYAQTSRFSEACELVSQAIEILPQGKTSPQADALRARLALYKEEKPYREPVPGAGQ